MNVYKTTFMVKCPVNGEIIRYALRIESENKVMVEDILSVVDSLPSTGYHEDVADSLMVRLPGHQVLTAHHHGVDIETTRTGAAK